MEFIDRIHKWRLSNYSFVFMLIILTSLVNTSKIQKNFSFQRKEVLLLSIYKLLYTEKEKIFGSLRIEKKSTETKDIFNAFNRTTGKTPV